MSDTDRMREARKLVQTEALRRYVERTAEREGNKAKIREFGPGAADSMQRRLDYGSRQRQKSNLRAILPPAQMPLGIERRLGATVDWTDVAPDDLSRKAGRCVARIVTPGGSGFERQGYATGFLVSADLLMTNWHVFSSRSDASGYGANFLYERTEKGIALGLLFELDPTRFFVSDQKLDFAIVAVKPKSVNGDVLADLGQNTLIEATPKILKGQPVNIIEYPRGGTKKYAISENRLVDIIADEGFLQYETDTDEGASGSPAFSADWELVALHHASIPLMRDGRVVATDGDFWSEEMGDDRVKWIANEGARVSAIVARLAGITLDDPAQQTILKDLLATTVDPVAEATASLMSAGSPESIRSGPHDAAGSEILSNARGDAMSGVQFTFTGPVTININAGSATPATAVQSAEATAKSGFAVESAIRFDPDYNDREGYDPAFLGSADRLRVPVPQIHADRVNEMLMGEDGEPLVLKYHHFELVMNRKRRLQAWSAVNIDYAPGRKSSRAREEFGRDRWVPDPRIPANVQIFDADFYKPAGNIDRGHIVRREDNAWGDSEIQIEYANADTFHWTNCTPQHEAFNQSTPGRNDTIYKGMEGVWGGFENVIQQSRAGGDTKACLLAGPILAKSDPTADFGRGLIPFPIRFWKIVCIADAGEQSALKVFGFILSQADVVGRFGIEKFNPGRFKRFQAPLGDIAAAAGLVFDQRLLDADTMAGALMTEIAAATSIRGL